MNKRSLTALLLVALGAVGIFLYAAFGPRRTAPEPVQRESVPNEGLGRQQFAAGRGGPPIEGEPVSLDAAASRVAFPVLILPEIVLRDPCSGGEAALSLQGVWVSPTSTPTELREVGVTYSHGIWMALHPKQTFAFGDKSEMPTVEEAFDPRDFPEGLETGEVRGHVAHINEADADPCPPAPTTSANLMWMEEGAVVQLVGPFQSSQMISLAAGMAAAKN